MIKFSTTSNFNRRIAGLKAIKRGVYATVEEEIRVSFQGFGKVYKAFALRVNLDCLSAGAGHAMV